MVEANENALASRPGMAEMASLAERMGYLQALRVAFGITVLLAGIFASEVVGTDLADLALPTGGYLILSAVAEGLRRSIKGRGLSIVAGMLLIDGIYLAWIQYATGGTHSELRFTVSLHLIAVTLLASYRTGLKIALWHSLLYFVVFYSQASGLLPEVEPISGSGADRPQLFGIIIFWMVALGTAAFSALNERELRRRKVDLEALAAMASQLEFRTSPEGVAQTLLDSVGDNFGFERGLVLGGPNKEVHLIAYRGKNEPADVETGRDAVVQRSWDEHRPILVAQLDAEANPQIAKLLPDGANFVVLPLFAEGNPVGALVVEHSSPRIERRILVMLEQFAAHAALALRNAWLLGQVQKLAETDALTGVANRRTFETELEAELSRARRNGEELTLVMIDIDHFKSLNDTYGHQVGDDVLRGLAGALGAHCRDFDTIARYGGEEFAVILPSCTLDESPIVAERLRGAVSEVKTLTTVTASAGSATFPVHAHDAESLIKAADDALYESKRAGRNRVTMSQRLPAAREPEVAGPAASA